MHQACHQGDTHTVEFLLSHGADITVTTRDKETPKMIAMSRGHSACVNLIDAAASATPPPADQPPASTADPTKIDQKSTNKSMIFIDCFD